ncbi:hypothetical protein JYT90_01075 [bacterium AH-315-P07]|nr:hypothetical protein [bacterium AH-315-P07]
MFLCIALSGRASAQDNQLDTLSDQIKTLTQSVEQLRSALNRQQQRIESLEKENAHLKDTLPEPSPAAPAPTTNSASSKSLNPDIGVVIDMVGLLSNSKEDEEGSDKASIRELEITIGHDIDPFTRFDSTLALSDFEDGVEIEEAYVTLLKMPWDLSARVGRIKPLIGKVNALHRDQLDTVDEPLVIQRYLGVEGLSRTGVEVARFLPQFNDAFTQQLTLGILEGGIGEDGSLFGDVRRHPTAYAHLKNFFEISPNTSIEIGNTFMTGSAGENDRNAVQAFGLDLTAEHHFDAIRRLKSQSEFYLQDRDDAVLNENAFGYYSLLDYRLNQRFGIGARYDNVERIAFAGKDKAVSTYITFYQSEFARLRIQYQNIDFAEGGKDNRLYLQGTFAIGVHKHAIK